MKKVLSSKIISLLLIALLSLAFPFSCFADAQSELDDIESQIDEKTLLINQNNEKLTDLDREILALDAEIVAAQEEIDKLTFEINDTKEKINIKLRELEQKEAEIEKQDQDLSLRLRTMYKNGNYGMLSVILNSSSITNLLTNIEMSKRIYASDSNLLYKMHLEYDEIFQVKLELTHLKDYLIGQQNQLQAMKEALDADQAKLEEKKAALKSDTAELKAQMDALQLQADRLTEEIRRMQGDGDYTGGTMCWPAAGGTYISSYFGTRYIFGGYSFHSGIDIPAYYGTAIYAANSGTVLWTGYDQNGYGNYVMIDHGGGIVTLYGHSSKVLVYPGQYVARGETIALIGSTGLSTGCHVHFEIRVNGSYQNPLDTSARYYVVPGVY